MKRRLLAFTLALTMSFSSLVIADENVVDTAVNEEVSVEEAPVSDEISIEEEQQALEEEDAELVEDAEEQEAVENEDSAEEVSGEEVSVEEVSAEEVNSDSSSSSSSSSDTVSEDIATNEEVSLGTLVTDWTAGATGGKHTFKVNSDGSITTVRGGANSGKWSNTDDQFAYYAPTKGIDITKDFVFTAKMNIDGLLTGGDTNQAQCSAGMLIMAPIQKTPPSVSLGIAMESNSSGYIAGNTRGAFDDEGNYKVQARPPANKDGHTFVRLSESFGDGNNKGTFDLKIEKSGYSYILTCGDQKVKYDYAKENFMGADGTNTLIFPAFYSARDVIATFSDIKLDVDERIAESVVIIEPATDNTALVGNEPELPGLKVGIKYTDGSVKEVTEGYAITGYDKDKVGKQNAKITIGEFSADYEVEILKKACTSVQIVSLPMKVDYYEGQYFRTDNFVVEADYNDGSHVELKREDYDLVINGKVLEQDQFFTADMAGKDIDFVVRRKETEELSSGTATASFKGSVSPLKLDNIRVTLKPAKQTYYLGEEQTTNGMIVKGYYTDGETTQSAVLQASEYTVSDNLDTSKLGTQQIVVTSKFNPSLTYSFDVKVQEKRFVEAYISSYPRTTYPVLTGVTDYNPQYWYDHYNGKADGTMGTDEDGTKQYNQGNLQITYVYSSGEEIIAPESEYKVILDNFDIRDPNKKDNQIKIVYPEGSEAFGTPEIVLPITVKDFGAHHWKPIIFGASTTASKSRGPEKDKMGMIMTDAAGNVTNFDTTDCTGTSIGTSYSGTTIEEEGSSLRIWALQGAGKQADSNDGISFYYTRLSTKDDFRLSADVLVNSYINGDTDENRDGQEGFGIMARDVVSLTPNKDNVTKVSGKIQFVYTPDKALKDANGEPEPYSTAIYNYSNMVLLGGHSGSGWPADPEADTYLFNTTKNRINLIYRTFIDGDPYSASSNVMRTAVKKTLCQDFPSPGSRYHLVFEKVPGGYKGTCYDYQTKEFRTDFVCYDETEDERDLDVLDPDNLYVGFFATRYADITVSNVDLVLSDPATDKAAVIDETQKQTVPKLYLKSNIYSTNLDYKLILRTSNNSGGRVTIQQDGKTIFSDAVVKKAESVFPVKLKENSISTFTVMYTPSYISEDDAKYQELTSYDATYYEYKISHKGNFDTSKKFIYVSPDGDPAGDATITDPITFDVALGLMKRGQSIILLPGVYYRNEKNIEIDATNAGTSTAPKAIIGYNKYQAEEEGYAVDGVDIPEGEVVFDLNGKYAGFVNHADFWTFKNFNIRNGGKNSKAFHTGGDNGLIENIKVYNCQDSGICLSRTSSSQETIKDWPTNNIFKNCESWNNADASFNNSDGFATKLTVGYGNKLIGCVSHHNSDDGWDLFCKQSGGYMAPITLERCITYKGGYKLVEDGTDRIWSESRGGKNGFKMGGDYMPIDNVMIDCIAFENGNSGVTSNSNPLMTVRGAVGYKNKGSNFSMGSNSSQAVCDYDIKGIVSYKGGSNDGIQNYNYDKDYNYLRRGDESTNASGEVVTADFFVSLESPVVNGRIPQDPKTGEFLLNGFLELTEATKAKIQSCEGYEDIEETTEAESQDSEYDSDDEVKGYVGGGSAKRTSSPLKTDKDKEDEKSTEKESEKSTETVEDETAKTEDASEEVKDDADNDVNSDSDSIEVTEEVEKVELKVDVDVENPDKVIVVVTDENGNETVVKSAQYDPTTGTIVAPYTGNGTYSVKVSDVTFDDMNSNWANKYVEALAARGIINGVAEGKFAPNAQIKRGDFVLMLTKVIGIESNESAGFADVADSDYYSGAIAAAKEYGLVSGTGEEFGAKANITRQDVMTIIARTLESAGVDMSAADLSQFNDAANISEYAKDSVAKLVGLGIVNGNNGAINPKDSLTRSEAAKMLYEVWKRF